MKSDGRERGTGYVLAMLMVALTSASRGQAPERGVEQARAARVVLVSIPDRQLAVMEAGKVLAFFAVAVGAQVSPSPEGEFEIVSRVANPAYYHQGAVIEAGRENPLGTRWMGLSVKGYGIHGTNVPRSIGHATSHGCIRLRNGDVEKLYKMLRLGDVVRIRGERDEEVAGVFGGGERDAARANEALAGQ